MAVPFFLLTHILGELIVRVLAMMSNPSTYREFGQDYLEWRSQRWYRYRAYIDGDTPLYSDKRDA